MGTIITIIVFVIVGIGFCYVGFQIGIKNKIALSKGVRTKANIVGFTKRQIKDAEGESFLYYFPIIIFKDLKGLEIRKQLGDSLNPTQINKQIDIVYLEEKDDYFIVIIGAWWQINLPVILKIMGLLFLVAGIVVFVNHYLK